MSSETTVVVDRALTPPKWILKRQDEELAKASDRIEFHLDVVMVDYLFGGLPPDERLSAAGEMRGLSVALAVLRNTSGMEETLDSERRVRARESEEADRR